MKPQAIQDAAEILHRHRMELIPFVELPDACLPANEEEAYAVQFALHGLLEASLESALAGYKIGCTTPVMQEYLGIDHPCAGGILTAGVHPSPVKLPHANFVKVGVEGEIAVRLKQDLSADFAPYSAESLPDFIAECMPAIELVDDRYLDYTALEAPTLIADDFFGAGCVLGAPLTGWRDLNLSALRGTFSVDGKPVGEGLGGDVMGNPLAAVAWLANMLLEQEAYLRQGQIVLTGSIVQTVWIDPGAECTFAVEGLGKVEAGFD